MRLLPVAADSHLQGGFSQRRNPRIGDHGRLSISSLSFSLFDELSVNSACSRHLLLYVDGSERLRRISGRAQCQDSVYILAVQATEEQLIDMRREDSAT